MKVKFRTNLGSVDAAKVGLDHTKCQDGCEVDVAADVAKALADRGIVEPLPEKRVTGEAKAPEVKGVTEPEEKAKKKTDGK